MKFDLLNNHHEITTFDNVMFCCGSYNHKESIFLSLPVFSFFHLSRFNPVLSRFFPKKDRLNCIFHIDILYGFGNIFKRSGNSQSLRDILACIGVGLTGIIEVERDFVNKSVKIEFLQCIPTQIVSAIQYFLKVLKNH